MRILILTDLDGTLLNHNDYSYQDAKPALERIKRENIPLIIVTSKTRREVEILQNELGIKDPSIVENGGGIFFPSDYRHFRIADCIHKDRYCLIKIGKSYGEIRKFFLKAKDNFGIKGFGDMRVDEIIKLTNLPPEKVKFAKEREFTEPFIIEKVNKIEELKKLALKEDIKITKGGRFYHLMGICQDKGKAVRITKNIFKENLNENIVTIGLGDSQNDIPMLKGVDFPCLIPKPNGKYEKTNLSKIIKAEHPGSKGWNESVNTIIDLILNTGS